MRTGSLLTSIVLLVCFNAFGQDAATRNVPGHLNLGQKFPSLQSADVDAIRKQLNEEKLSGDFGASDKLRAALNAPRPKSLPKFNAESGKCAHIIVKRVTPEMDPAMTVRAPGTQDAMPMVNGAPVCAEDVR